MCTLSSDGEFTQTDGTRSEEQRPEKNLLLHASGGGVVETRVSDFPT